MYIFVLALMCFEIAQFYVLHRLYLKEIENWIECIVFISAACTPLIRVETSKLQKKYITFVLNLLLKLHFSFCAVGSRDI